MKNTELPTKEEIMLAKILTLIDQHEAKQRQFLSAFDEFITDIENRLDITEN
jgi:hypothetical protein